MLSSRPLARTASRRRLLGGGAASAVGLAALGLGLPRLAGSTPRTASAQTGPWTGGEVPLASRSSRQMAVAARAFLNTLGPDQLGSVWYANLSDPARTRWSNFPAGASPRPGVPLGDLSESQRVRLHDLLRASTSSQGYRVHGPRILIEYDVQEPLTSQGGHVHAITRDPANDYGMDWLGLHYQESSPLPGGPGGPGGAPPGGGRPTP